MNNDIVRETAKIMVKNIGEVLLGIAIFAGALVVFISIIFSIMTWAFYFGEIPINPSIPWYVFVGAYFVTGATIVGVIAFWVACARQKARERIMRERSRVEED